MYMFNVSDQRFLTIRDEGTYSSERSLNDEETFCFKNKLFIISTFRALQV